MMSSKPTTRVNAWREVALMALMIMEVSWVVPWFRALTPATYAVSAGRAFIILIGMMLTAHILIRFMDYIRLRTKIKQWITIGLLVSSILFGLKMLLYPHESIPLWELINRPLRSLADWKMLIPNEFVIMLVVIISWWRGISLAHEHIGPSTVMGYFQIGYGMFVAFVFVNTLVTGESPGFFIYLFLFGGLMAMITSRIAVLKTLRGGRQSVFDRGWFLGVAGASLAVVLLAAVSSNLIGDNLAWFGLLLLGIFGSLAVLIWAVISPFLALLINLFSRLSISAKMIQDIANRFEQLQEVMREFSLRVSEFMGKTGILDVFENIATGMKSIILWGIVLAVLVGVVLWVTMRLWKERIRQNIDENQQSLLGQGDLWRIFQAALNKRWQNLLKNLTRVTDLRQRQRLRTAARVRQIYSDLLELCVDLGRPRIDAQTPLEFETDLKEIFPSLVPQLDMITQAYMRIRYGQLPETRQEVEEIEAAWKLVSEQGKTQLASVRQGNKKAGLAHGKSAAKPHVN